GVQTCALPIYPVRFHQRADANIPEDDVDPSGGPVSMHLDVFVPAEFAEQRMQNAIEAGGKLLSEADAPSMWELADLDGNRAYLRSEQSNTYAVSDVKTQVRRRGLAITGGPARPVSG